MSLTQEDVFRVAQLARLELSAADAQATLDKLNGIFDLIAQMQAVDTTGVAPLAHPQDLDGGLAQRLREDAVSEVDHRDAYQAVAPAVEAGLFLVPRVIE